MSKKISYCIVSALLLAAPFLFPPLFLLAWVAFVPLFWVVGQADEIRRAVFFGWLTGFFAHLFGFYWLVHTISVFGGFSYPVSSLLFLIYAALQGIQMALFAFAVRYFGHGPLSLFPPLFWVALEFWFPLLFPWYLANSQSSFITFIQTADLVGPFGASLTLMWANAVIYASLATARGQSPFSRGTVPVSSPIRWQPAVPVGLLIVGSLIYGAVRLNTVSGQMASAPKLSIAAVQGNIDVDLKWDPKRAKENLEVYRNLTQQTGGVALVIWPETSIEEWVPEALQQLPPEVMPPLSPETTHFIFGAKSFYGRPAGADFKAYNTAFLTDATGRILDRYHKQVLLAFGEYIPFSKILSKLPAMPFSDGFTPGDGPHTLDLSSGQRIAPLICYEDLMPHLSRGFVKETKANLLVNLTNDSWYGRTVAPWQHARLAQWRAIETRRSLLRVTNTGVTVSINARGEMEQALPIFTPAVLTTNVDVLEGETFYVRFGDWFAWGATLVSLALVPLLWKKGGGTV
ncbi:MAG: apolipoprotein N-acyltransferase [Candidatus Binatia bacterium]